MKSAVFDGGQSRRHTAGELVVGEPPLDQTVTSQLAEFRGNRS